MGLNFFFDFPYALLLALLVPAYLYWYARFDSKRLILRLSVDPTQFVHSNNRLTALARYLPTALWTLAYLFMVLALARPQRASEYLEKKSAGIDVMLVLDVSSSMETQDFKPNRITVARQSAINFIDQRPDDRIGVVVFAEDAFSYAPLTLDHSFLRIHLAELSTSVMPKQGTALGSAMAVAINRLEENPKRARAMVLLTDGAANLGRLSPIAAAELAAEKGIKIYAVGVGKPQYLQTLPNGKQEVILTDMDEPTLKKCAELTGGQFFKAEDQRALDKIFKQISALQTSAIGGTVYRDVEDLYPYFLFPAIVFMLLALAMVRLRIANPLEE